MNCADFVTFRKGLVPGETVAFLNAAHAPFADAFIIFKELVVLIHEKNFTTARQKRLSGVDCPMKSYQLVHDEYDKVKSLPVPFVFVYATDMVAPICVLPAELAENTFVCGVEQHKEFFGPILTTLRCG